MSNSVSYCHRCNEEWLDDQFDEETGLCPLCMESEERNSPYCEECGACGDSGCCPPNRCKCLYGEVYKEDYRDLLDENESFRNILNELRLESVGIRKLPIWNNIDYKVNVALDRLFSIIDRYQEQP